MTDARERVLAELEAILKQVGMQPSPFAKIAKVQGSTLTRFRKHKDASVLSNRTMQKLRDARDEILAAQDAAFPIIKSLAKDSDKRALIARLINMSPAQEAAVREALDRVPEPAPPKGKRHNDPA